MCWCIGDHSTDSSSSSSSSSSDQRETSETSRLLFAPISEISPSHQQPAQVGNSAEAEEREKAVAEAQAKLKRCRAEWRDQIMEMTRVEYQLRIAEVALASLGVEPDGDDIIEG